MAIEPAVREVLRRLRNGEVDARGIGVFRALFGLVLLFSTIRFVAMGWVDELILAPKYHFTYPGFEWVQPFSPGLMYGLYGVMGASALGLCLGVWARVSALSFFLSFTYAELIDKTTYLNHYYFVSVVSFLFVLFPSDAAFSWTARRRGQAAAPRLAYWTFRAQVAMVYLFAGLAKLNADWLFRAEPLRTWLSGRAEIFAPLGDPKLAFLMSWAGAAFDLSAPFLLSIRRTRSLAYGAVIAFHVITWLLFPIGIFPWVMIAAATVFFEPSWPGRLGIGATSESSVGALRSESRRPGTLKVVLVGAFLLAQGLLPLRHWLYPGEVNWHERGFRFAWRVMLIEKTGLVEYEVLLADGRRFREFPRKHLTPLQYKMLTTQPDMIVDYARYLAREYRRKGLGDVAVYARSYASLNRRPSQPLVRPDVNLAAPLDRASLVVPFRDGPR